jgi:alkylhydroperoxidase family enzyme
VVDAILRDPATAPFSEKLRAMLAFLERLTLVPSDVGPDDVARLRAAGVSDAAAREALYSAFVFGVMDRLADAFGFKLSNERNTRWIVRLLLGPGYKVASVGP